MQNTGNLNSLTEKLKAKTELERQQMETLIRQQFDTLSRSLHESSKNALSTTEAAILHQLMGLEQSVTSRCRILSAAFGWKCLQALAINLCILAGITFSGWGLLTLAEKKITALHREVTMLSERKESLEAQSARIWTSFKGMEPHRAEGKDYLLLPAGRKFQLVGFMPDKREAWEIVRK